MATHGASAQSDPGLDAVAVTKSDSTVLTGVRGLYVGSTGDVAVTMPSGNVTFTTVPAGMILPIECSKVLSTGTTASNIVAFK